MILQFDKDKTCFGITRNNKNLTYNQMVNLYKLITEFRQEVHRLDYSNNSVIVINAYFEKLDEYIYYMYLCLCHHHIYTNVISMEELNFIRLCFKFINKSRTCIILIKEYNFKKREFLKFMYSNVIPPEYVNKIIIRLKERVNNTSSYGRKYYIHYFRNYNKILKQIHNLSKHNDDIIMDLDSSNIIPRVTFIDNFGNTSFYNEITNNTNLSNLNLNTYCF